MSLSSSVSLRWWQRVLFILPAVAAIATAAILIAVRHSPLTSSIAVIGALTGAACCLLSGIILGLTYRPQRRALACVGWTLLCLMTNTAFAIAGGFLLSLVSA